MTSSSPLLSLHYECHVPTQSPPIHRLLLDTVAALCLDTHHSDLTITSLDNDKTTSPSLCLQTTRHNRWMNVTERSVSIGLMGVLLSLVADWLRPPHRSWLDSAHETVLVALSVAPSHPQYAAVRTIAQQFVSFVDAHLQRTANTYLEGKVAATLSDVVIAITLSEFCHVTQVALPTSTHRWMTTVVGKVCTCIESSELKEKLQVYLQLPRDENSIVIPIANVQSSVAVEPKAAVQETAPKQQSKDVSTAPKAAAQSDTTTAATAAATPTPTAPSATQATPDPKSTNASDATTTAAPTNNHTAPTDAATSSDARIFQLLDEWKIPYEVYDHAACTTADELVQTVSIPAKHSHTKNLLLRDKKHGLVLITTRPDVTVPTNDLKTHLHLTGKCNFRLATPELLRSTCGCAPGCLGLLCLGLYNDNKTTSALEPLTVLLDQSLLRQDRVHSHPARNDQSVILAPTDLLQYLKHAGFPDPILVDFDTAAVTESAKTVESAEREPTKKSYTKKPPAEPNVSDPHELIQPQKEATATLTALASPTNKKVVKKGETLLALQWKKQENFASWYTDVIVLSEMISYYDISGCYILRPWSYKMWELIQEYFNPAIQKLGVENAYFPLFVSQDRLEREKDHVEGFAPEVAWVTKSGSGDLARPIAIRPTSETIMYPTYADWIQSHRDLPLKLNQWSNVVRWEFKYPTPFLRTREFLWQEGHTAHSTFEDAEVMVLDALELYRSVYEDLLAVPVVKGYKTEKEKFAGGHRTTTVEAYIAGSGRAIQGATSHHLGQNFGKMFDITFQNDKGQTETVYQTSWGLTTRTIGVMVMVHGDDQGLVLPPRVAPLQVVLVPIVSKKLTYPDAEPYCLAVLQDLQQHNIRARYDDRRAYNPGWKYHHWEQKGVPIRLEIGPNDIKNRSVRVVIRHDNTKFDLAVDGLGDAIVAQLKEIQATMFAKAKTARDEHVVTVTDWKDFVPNLEQHNLVLTPWCGGEHSDWEDYVKQKSRDESLQSRGKDAEDEQTAVSVAAKTLCIPFDQPNLPAGTKCIASGLDATCWILWGRSY